MPTVLRSRREWSRLEKRSQQGQKEFLDGWKDKFRYETVSSERRNIKKGDHLVFEGAKYDHHLLCSGVTKEENDDIAEIIEYTGSSGSRNCSSGSARVAFSLDFTGVGGIKKKKYTYEELEAKNAIKVIWPDELKRFDVDERVRRAERREGETYYDCLKNNCEHFVTWCICGLRASLQVKSWHIWARETVYSLFAGGKDCITQNSAKRLVPYLLKVSANVTDELVGIVGGAAIGAVLEAGVCIYEIKKAFDQRDSEAISQNQFEAKLVEIIAKAICRLGLGAAGSAFGLACGPLGSLVGGFIGGLSGHLLGYCIGWCYENREYLEG